MRALATLVFLAVFVASGAQAQQLSTVRLATLAPGALLWIHYIAEAEGFYKENQLNVRALQVADSSTLVQAVATGSADAGISLGDLDMRAIDQGARIIMVGGYVTKSSLVLVGAKGVETPQALAGSAVTAGAVRGGTANLMLYELKQFGVDPDSVHLVSIANSADRLIALEDGRVRGALMSPPFDILATRKGLPILYNYPEPYLQTPLIVNTRWAARSPEVVKRLVRASREAAAWLCDPAKRAEAVGILAKETGIAQDVVDDSYQFLVLEQHAFSCDLSISDEAIANILKVNQAVQRPGPSKKIHDLNIAKYYDPSYLAAAR
ncbi:MAG: ABC transporter substrate-binding protein [Acetobacteraceae bacterium]